MTVVDPDEAGVGTLDVDVLVRRVTPSGEVIVETETITLTESPAGSGTFVADVLTIDLSGADKGAATRVGGAGSLDVLVRNLASGELATVALSESPDNSGLFSGSLSTALSGGTSTSGNGTLGVAVGDTIEVQ